MVQGADGGRRGEALPNGYGDSLGGEKRYQMEVIVAKYCECTKGFWILHT